MFPTRKMMTLGIGLIVVGTSIMMCANKMPGNLEGENKVGAKTIQQVLKEHTKDLMSIPGVVGTAQGLCDGKPCIKVLVIEKTPELDQKIPGAIEGYPVMIEETGEIRALPKDQD